MKKLNATYLLLLIGIALISGCIKEVTDTIDKASKIDRVRWDPSLAVPLVYSDLNFSDFIDGTNIQQYLQVANDGQVSLVYEDKYTSEKAEDVFDLLPQNYGETFTFTGSQLAALNALGEVTVSYTRVVSYSGNGNELDKVWFKNGQIDLNMTSTFEHDLTCSITLPDSKKGTDPLALNLDASYMGSPLNENTSIDLSSSEIDFTQTVQGHSELVLELEFTVRKIAGNAIKPIETVSYSMDMINQEFSKITGYFAALDFDNYSGQFSIPFFENSVDGFVNLAEPELKFVSSTTAGIPLDLTFSQFEGTNNHNTVVALSQQSGPIVVEIPRAGVEGGSQTDSLVLDNTNSNIVDYLKNRPISNIYQASIAPNTSSIDRHWMLDTSRLRSRFTILFPLYGTINAYTLENTQPFNLTLQNAEEIKEVLVRLYTENSFPVDVTTQLYFEDSVANVTIDSLLIDDATVFEAAQVDDNGKSVSKTMKTIDVLMESSRVDAIRLANRVRLKAVLSSLANEDGTQPSIRIYDENKILLQLGVQAEILIDQKL